MDINKKSHKIIILAILVFFVFSIVLNYQLYKNKRQADQLNESYYQIFLSHYYSAVKDGLRICDQLLSENPSEETIRSYLTELSIITNRLGYMSSKAPYYINVILIRQVHPFLS